MNSFPTEEELQRLRKEQTTLARKIILRDDFSRPLKTIGGFDLAFDKDRVFGAGVVLDYRTLKLIEVKTLVTEETFPYIPTFLSYREGPVIIEIYRKLKNKPDLLFVNGHGVAHPLSLGLASYVGVLINRATIGVARSKLCGKFKKPGTGKQEKLTFKGKQVGWVLRIRKDFREIFVSPGHMVSLESSVRIARDCLRNHKLPEPLRLAHLYANRVKMEQTKG